ncbi:MAG TPA: iron-containing redox enzyme family protein [Pyrinomonadaceae bacterium]
MALISKPEFFHTLVNIEDYQDFIPKAKELAQEFFSHARFDADDSYKQFPYTAKDFDDRMDQIYQSSVDVMNNPSSLDSGEIAWPVVIGRDGDKEITKDKPFKVGRFSDRAVKERLFQRAPFNLTDGAWIQNILSTGPVDEVRARIFSIWIDEAGNGETDLNHCNVYDTLLKSLNIFLPPITTREFIDLDFLPAAFETTVFELCVSLFPEEFLPEILGMTIFLEYTTTPDLTPAVRLYEGRRIDPHFYRLHVAIDNISAGHGAKAKEAIKLFLEQKDEEGGDKAVQEHWQRIWRGYVTWATAGDLGSDLLERCLIIDRKQIDIGTSIFARDDFKDKDVTTLARKLATPGNPAEFIFNKLSESTRQAIKNSGAGNLPDSVQAAVISDLNIVLVNPLYDSEAFKGVKFTDQTLKLIKADPKGAALVDLNRIILGEIYPEIQKRKPQLFPDYKKYFHQRMAALIKRKAPVAKEMHKGINLAGKNLSALFDDPDELMNALITVKYVDKNHPRDSKFFEFLEFNGPMYKVFTEREKGIILDWIESLRDDVVEPAPPTSDDFGAQMAELIRLKGSSGASTNSHHGRILLPDSNGRTKPITEWFSDPQGLMQALIRGGWVVPANLNDSLFLLLIEDGGPMSVFFNAAQVELVKSWIAHGARLPGDIGAPGDDQASPVVSAPVTDPSETFVEQLLNSSVITEPGFAQRKKLIGMGSVH